MNRWKQINPRGRTVALIAAVAVLVSTVGYAESDRHGGNELVAHFTNVSGIYVGDDVTVLGVRVGTIDKIEPRSQDVEVTMTLRDDVRLPENVKASIVAQSLVSVRAVALYPAYESGPELSDRVIPISRTAVPVEWDEIKTELVRLSKALGPKGANKDGSLSRLVSSGAGFMDGNGAQLNRTLVDLSQAMSTLSDNSGDLFGTVRNLSVFTSALKSSDHSVRTFFAKLEEAAAVLAGLRSGISQSVVELGRTFRRTTDFLAEHTDLTGDTLRTLRATTAMVSGRRQDIADLLQVAPTVVPNVRSMMDPRVQGATGVPALTNLNSPAAMVCGAMLAVGASAQQCATVLEPVLRYLRVSAPPLGLGLINNNDAGVGGVGTPPPAAAVPEGDRRDNEDPLTDLLGQVGLLLGDQR